jgi:hypothetical protein
MARLRPSPAMVVAFIALVVSVTSGAYAAVRVTTRDIADGAVTQRKLSPNAVWHANLGNNVVRRRNIGKGGVAHHQLSPNAVWHANLGRTVVRENNVHDGAITHTKLGTGAVEKSNLSSQLLSEIQRGQTGQPGQPGPPGQPGKPGEPGKAGANGANPAKAVVNVPALTPGEDAQGYPESGKTGDQGFFFTGRDAQGSAKLEGGQLVLHGVGVSAGSPQGSMGIAKAFSNVPLSHLDALSYTWHVNTLNGNQAPTIHITVTDLTADSRFASGFANLVYSPGLAGGNGVTVDKSVQYQSDGFASDAGWYSTTSPNVEGSISQHEPLSFFVGRNPHAVITLITLGNGGASGSTGDFEAGADNLILGFTGSPFTRYDFDS